MVCVERQAQQYDIENMNLLFYDEVLRGVESLIRDREWSAADHLPAAGGARTTELPSPRGVLGQDGQEP